MKFSTPGTHLKRVLNALILVQPSSNNAIGFLKVALSFRSFAEFQRKERAAGNHVDVNRDRKRRFEVTGIRKNYREHGIPYHPLHLAEFIVATDVTIQSNNAVLPPPQPKTESRWQIRK